MGNCIFCKIVKGDIPAKLLYDGKFVIAIDDANPQAPIHCLIIPKKHIKNTTSLTEDDDEMLAEMFKVTTLLAKEKGVDEKGFRNVINQGMQGGQSVDHLHLHLLGGRPMGWPPG